MSEEETSILDLARLESFLDDQDVVRAGPLRAELIEGGRSNLTYLLTDGARRWVLRRPPLGLVAPTANDVAREFRVIYALGPSPVPVPEAVALCEDPDVIGAPFALATFVEGRVVRSAEDAASLSAAEAKRCASALVEALAAIHAVDPEAVGLAELGRPEGYLERQVSRWYRQWGTVRTRTLDLVDELHSRLEAVVPAESGSGIVHGDFRVDNTILATDDPGRVVAVLDWEMATLGDPLADLGVLLAYWDPAVTALLPDGHPISANPGFPSASEVAEEYGVVSGRSIEDLDFHRALAYFKLAVIAEGIHRRFEEGLTVGEGFEGTGEAVTALAERGLEVLGR